MFEIITDIEKVERMFRDGPKVYGRAAAVMVNQWAFDMKNREIVDFMSRKMTVRNRKFAKARLRVQKAKPRSNINLIVSKVGSVADKPRFTGWIEQELGKRTVKTRTAGLGARGGAKGKRMRPSARMRPGRHPGPAELGIKSTRTKSRLGQAKVMLVWTRREGWRKPFRIFGHDRISDGLVQWKGKRLIRLQYFKRQKEAQPEPVRWLRGSRDEYMRKLDMDREFKRAMRKVSRWK